LQTVKVWHRETQQNPPDPHPISVRDHHDDRVFVRVALEGEWPHSVRHRRGLLVSKWFTKNPLTTFEADLAEMCSVIHHACIAACQIGENATVFDCGPASSMHSVVGRRAGSSALLWGFGVSLRR
jgi:hypothetical protein